MNDENTYEPPDENFITIGAEHFYCAEVLLLSDFVHNHFFTAIAEREIARHTELKSTVREKTCDLPDANIIFVVADRFRCVEVLFQLVSR